MNKTIGIIGPGVVGSALAKLLAGAGYKIAGVAGRTKESVEAAIQTIGAGSAVSPTEAAAAEIVFITTPDGAIGAVCAQLAATKAFHAEDRVSARQPRKLVIHCSGALPSSVLSPARGCGALIASLHPLQTFASVGDAIALLPGAASRAMPPPNRPAPTSSAPSAAECSISPPTRNPSTTPHVAWRRITWWRWKTPPPN